MGLRQKFSHRLFSSGLLTALAIFSATTSFAGQERGGGDEYALDFVQTAHRVSLWLSLHTDLPVQEADLDRAINETTVDSTDEVLRVNGVLKDAINEPARHHIIFNRPAWDRVSTASARNALVFHEYLGILRIDDTNYHISNQVLVVPAGAPATCAQALPSQQNLFRHLNAFRRSHQDRDLFAYLSALEQYQIDVDTIADHSRPDWGGYYATGIFESAPAWVCTDAGEIERRANAGNTKMIQFVLMYAAVAQTDGAEAEDVEDMVTSLRAQYPAKVRRILQQYHVFFAQHPIPSLAGFVAAALLPTTTPPADDHTIPLQKCLDNGGRANDGPDGEHLLCEGGTYDGYYVRNR